MLHSEFIPQIRNKENWQFNHQNFAEGLYVFAIGLFKKVLLADTFALEVTWAWNSVNALTSVDILITMLCYTFQIYFDFSGYSDMAYGLGKMFNITFPRNFNSPYKALSILDFWDRWHMTLTRFLRNYVYFPLGGSRCGNIRTYINVCIVFLISGIWHGANWTFILWGGIHGVANILNRITKKFWNKVPRILRWGCTFSFVNVLWLLFRADNIGQFWNLITRMFRYDGLPISTGLAKSVFVPEIGALNVCFEGVRELSLNAPHVYIIAFIMIGLLICVKGQNVAEKEFRPSVKNAIVITICLVWSIISFSSVSTFIYFNF